MLKKLVTLSTISFLISNFAVAKTVTPYTVSITNTSNQTTLLIWESDKQGKLYTRAIIPGYADTFVVKDDFPHQMFTTCQNTPYAQNQIGYFMMQDQLTLTFQNNPSNTFNVKDVIIGNQQFGDSILNNKGAPDLVGCMQNDNGTICSNPINSLISFKFSGNPGC